MDSPQFSNQFIIIIFTFIFSGLLQQEFAFYKNQELSYIHLTRNYPTHLKTAWAPFSSNYLDILEECCEWETIDDPHNATILWTRAGPQEINPAYMRLGEGQLYSLVEGTDIMTDKADLHKLLAEFNLTSFQPETYNMGNREECREFFLKARKNPSIVWVSKEPGNSQGEGIVINPDLKELEKEWLIDSEAGNEDLRCIKLQKGEDDLVLQRYITNPLLLNKKKMEIRSYWLIAAVEPFIVFFHDGTVRLTTEDYQENDWKNPLIHITNTAQQKAADPNYYKTESERKWTVQQLASYLQQNNFIKNDTEYLDNILRPQLIHILKTVSLVAHPHFLTKKPKQGWDGRFELLGMDVILDKDLNVWLTEFQLGPGISRDPGVKEKTLPAMLEEMTDIVLEVDRELRVTGEVHRVRSAKEWMRVI